MDKTEKKYFNIAEDIFIGTVYIVPNYSTTITVDPFTLLHNEIANLPLNSTKLLVGDFNSRCGILDDYSKSFEINGKNDMIDNHLPNEVTENRIAMTLEKLNILQRKSEDTFVNTYGRNLIEFCKNTQMAIMNGRIGKDREFGRFTFMGSTNDTQNKQRLSLVDYIIGSANMFHYVTNLEVLNKFPE